MRKVFALFTMVAVAVLGVMVTPTDGEAVPAFARQTGNACSACHFQYFPKLNDMGRNFKLNAFTESSVDLIEDERLSIPVVFPLSFITKFRYVKTSTDGYTGVKKGSERGVWDSPDEATLFAGGRISENIGWSAELADSMWGKMAFIGKMNSGDNVFGVYWSSTDGHGPWNGMEILNTGLQKGQRAVEARKEVYPHSAGLYGAATTIAAYAGSSNYMVMVGLWGPAAGHIDAAFDFATVYRAVYMPTVGDWGLAIGVAGVSGKAVVVEAAGAEVETDIKTEAFVVDAQAQGELGNGMTLELQAIYCDCGGSDVAWPSNEAKTTSFLASLGVNPAVTLIAGYQNYEPATGDSVSTSTVAVSWAFVQNFRLMLEHAMGDKQDKTYLQFFGAF